MPFCYQAYHKYIVFLLLFSTMIVSACTSKVRQASVSVPTVSTTGGNAYQYYSTPQDFGAKADGKTDDTKAIQQAINYATANDRRLYFPAGMYLVKTTLKINKNIHIEGETREGAEIVFRPTKKSTDLFEISAKEYKSMTFEHLYFRMAMFGKGSPNSHCFHFKNSKLSFLIMDLSLIHI